MLHSAVLTICHFRINSVVILFRGGSKTAATSKMERFVIIVISWKPLTIITKRSILNVAAVLDPPLLFMEISLLIWKINLAKHDVNFITEKIKFSIQGFFSNFVQIRCFLRIWSHLLKKCLMGNFIFCALTFLLKIWNVFIVPDEIKL